MREFVVSGSVLVNISHLCFHSTSFEEVQMKKHS